jgi:hypothetical protein
LPQVHGLQARKHEDRNHQHSEDCGQDSKSAGILLWRPRLLHLGTDTATEIRRIGRLAKRLVDAFSNLGLIHLS